MNKYSLGQIKRWKKVPKKVRSEIMSETVKQRWARLNDKQRKEWCEKLRAFKKGKKLASFYKEKEYQSSKDRYLDTQDDVVKHGKSQPGKKISTGQVAE